MNETPRPVQQSVPDQTCADQFHAEAGTVVMSPSVRSSPQRLDSGRCFLIALSISIIDLYFHPFFLPPYSFVSHQRKINAIYCKIHNENKIIVSHIIIESLFDIVNIIRN